MFIYDLFVLCSRLIYKRISAFFEAKVDKSTGIEVVIIYFQSLMLIALGAYCSDHAVNFIVVSPFMI